MTLADLRKLTIRKQIQIRFRLRNGMECIITDHGVAQVPELKQTPDFNLEQELAHATDFQVEPAPAVLAKTPGRNTDRARRLQRKELAAMFETSPSAPAGAHDDHDDE